MPDQGDIVSDYGATMRVLQPKPHIFAFYDGRIAGTRLYSEAPNWLDDGAYALGVASYAIVDGEHALIYDTHISLKHATIIRSYLADRGVKSMRVVLSHHHDDHVAGNEVFADCEIIANELTAQALAEQRDAYENADPPIKPLILPTTTFSGDFTLTVGQLRVELRQFDIHSFDATVLWLPDEGLLFAGDTLEDTVTYVAEPTRLGAHLRDLDRLQRLPIDRILPCHGAPERIANGGYDRGLIDATRAYVEKLLKCRDDPALAAQDLKTFAADDLAAGRIVYFEPYEEVHRNNVAAMTAD